MLRQAQLTKPQHGSPHSLRQVTKRCSSTDEQVQLPARTRHITAVHGSLVAVLLVSVCSQALASVRVPNSGHIILGACEQQVTFAVVPQVCDGTGVALEQKRTLVDRQTQSTARSPTNGRQASTKPHQAKHFQTQGQARIGHAPW